jgi:hypothetical protein
MKRVFRIQGQSKVKDIGLRDLGPICIVVARIAHPSDPMSVRFPRPARQLEQKSSVRSNDLTQ